MRPRIRMVEAHPIQHQGQSMILLRDPLALSSSSIALPQPLGILLALMDGTRDEEELEAALQVRAGVRLATGLLSSLLASLDEAFLLDNERFAEAKAKAIDAYRQAPFRPMTLTSAGFPSDPEEARQYLQGFLDELEPIRDDASQQTVRALITPHIDYPRGGHVYAQVWHAAAQAVREAELVIVFGTDHQGGLGTLTLTRQSYATPWGVLPTQEDVVASVAERIGEETAFCEELDHRGEHSIELAVIWLHFMREQVPVPIVPILCGSFAEFVSGSSDPANHAPFTQAVDVLRAVMASQRTLVVASADLAHVGPAFGDRLGVDYLAQARLRGADERLLQTVCAGDADGFFEELRAEEDRRHVCGLPPIYMMLRLLGSARGELSGYDLCPADPQGTSFVSVAGAVLY